MTGQEVETRKIPTHALPAVQERLAKVAKHAARLGVAEPTLTIHGYSETTYLHDLLGTEVKKQWVEISIAAEAPRLDGGWQLVAAIEHHEAGKIVRVAPAFRGEEFGAQTDSERCEHCSTKRQRKMTVLLQSEAGERKVVGSSCLKDFLGHYVPSVWSIWEELDEITDSLDDERSWGGAGSLDMEVALVLAAELTLTVGFASSSTDWSTKQRVISSMTKTAHEDREVKITEQGKALAAEAKEWLAGLTDDELTDYTRNLRVALVAQERSHLGLVVSLPHAFLKAKERLIEREKVVKIEAAPVLLGKQQILGQVLSAYLKDTPYGSRLVMLVQDDRGFKVWGSVPSSISEAGTGDRVTFSATIEASDKEDFGFFKRPTKAQILAAA